MSSRALPAVPARPTRDFHELTCKQVTSSRGTASELKTMTELKLRERHKGDNPERSYLPSSETIFCGSLSEKCSSSYKPTVTPLSPYASSLTTLRPCSSRVKGNFTRYSEARAITVLHELIAVSILQKEVTKANYESATFPRSQ